MLHSPYCGLLILRLVHSIDHRRTSFLRRMACNDRELSPSACPDDLLVSHGRVLDLRALLHVVVVPLAALVRRVEAPAVDLPVLANGDAVV